MIKGRKLAWGKFKMARSHFGVWVSIGIGYPVTFNDFEVWIDFFRWSIFIAWEINNTEED